MGKYLDEVMRGTELLAKQPNVIFLGQSVCYHGHALSKTIKEVPAEKKLELPVFEDTQMGLSIGLALTGWLPVSIYPRFNFLLIAMNQLLNHLDRLPIMSHGQYNPKVIIKTMVGSERPLFPGEQHTGNFSQALRSMFKSVVLEDLQRPSQIMPAYERALGHEGATILVEHGDAYVEK